MIETTMQDREKELRHLLDQIAAHPERDSTEARERIRVLRATLGHAAGSDA
jgi:hypothetical protein